MTSVLTKMFSAYCDLQYAEIVFKGEMKVNGIFAYPIVIIVFGAKDTNKTTGICNAIDKIKINATNIQDLISTPAGKQLNQTPKTYNAPNDIFLTFDINGKKIAVLSAGDVKVDVEACLITLNMKFDVLICAARSHTKPSVNKFIYSQFGKNCVYININQDKLDTPQKIENAILSNLKQYGIL